MTVKITDHALVRWLTRAKGIDMEVFRAEMAAIAAPYAKACVKHAEIGGVWFVFDGNVLVTVTPDRPDINSTHKNDRTSSNGTHMKYEPLPWQAKKRRRDHR